MMDIMEWFSTLVGDYPGLSWIKYIFVCVLTLILFDAILTLLFRALGSLVGGGRK